MVIRQAKTSDIKHMQLIRNAVKENVLSDPALVPDVDVENYLNHRGKGWVCFDEERMAGFCIARYGRQRHWQKVANNNA